VRAVDVRPVLQAGRPALLLRDPLALSEQTVIIPQALGPALALCDGTRDSFGIRAALTFRFGLRVGPEVVDRLLAALDDVLLLENERFRHACAAALAAYRQAPFRPPVSAGTSYPADPAELRQLLHRLVVAASPASPDQDAAAAPPLAADRTQIPARGLGRGGLVSPHIDFARGGPVYAAVWQRAAEMLRAADLVVILGTDHYGDDLLTLTRQHYATPLGVLPTATDVVDALARAIGPKAAFAGELRHRSEHSIELAAVWLQFILAGAGSGAGARPAPTIVPVLCGSFAPFLPWPGRQDRQGTADPAQDPTIRALVEAFHRATAGRRVVVVAAADLAHVGPAFGGAPVDQAGRARLQAADDELIGRICAGDAAGFLAAIRREGDRNNVCGLPPIYLALRLLAPTTGKQVAYDRCPADDRGTSLVSVCGIVLSQVQVTEPAPSLHSGQALSLPKGRKS
jgi:predicted class III extradiol MEMO1 family dioxygenase